MINHTKKYREMTTTTVELLKASGKISPRLCINAFPLKVNGEERFVIRVGLETPDGLLGEGTAVHNPVDDFDPRAGILLAASRAYEELFRYFKGAAYRIMMENAGWRVTRRQKLVREFNKDPDALIRRIEAHRARLIAALDQGRVFYCPECKGHFASNKDPSQYCPHCKKSHTRKYWHTHKLDEFKDEREADDGEKGTVPSDPLP